ncbi:hypothetical protein C3L33_10861, partial [Rhododendron williamsianum]
MSCNGCRALRKGCSQSCILRPCLDWIESPQAQSNATLFVSKFFGRSDLMSFIGAVPENNRPALFQSLLFEACGRTLNPVNGAWVSSRPATGTYARSPSRRSSRAALCGQSVPELLPRRRQRLFIPFRNGTTIALAKNPI